MQNLNMIIGSSGEGKTKELIKRYVEFCQSKTLVDGLTYDTTKFVKPVFLFINDNKERLIDEIRNLGYYESHENLFIDIEEEPDKILTLWLEINNELQDAHFFMDINMPMSNTGRYMTELSNDLIPLIQKNVNINITLTVLGV